MKRLLLYTGLMIFLVIGGLLYVQHTKQTNVGSTVVPFDLVPEKVFEIVVTNADTRFSFKQGEDNHWSVIGGQGSDAVRVMADTGKIMSLLKALSTLVPLDIEESHLRTPSDFGFDVIHAHLEFVLSKKSDSGVALRQEVVVGGMPGSDDVYLWISNEGSTIYQVSSGILGVVSKSAPYYYDRRVLPFTAAHVVKAQLAQKYAGGWTVVRTNSGFEFELPAYLEGKEASSPEVKLYLLMLGALNGDEFISSDVTISSDPEVFINIWLDDGVDEPLRLDLFRDDAPDAGYLATSTYQPGVFRFDAESVRQLLKTPFELQGRRVIELDIGKVMNIRILSGDQIFVANKLEDGWFSGDTEKRLAGIDMSLWRFNELKFEALPLKNLPESAAWSMSCVFTDEDGGRVASLTFFSDPELPEGQSWLKNGGELYYPVSNQLMKDLQGLFPATAAP